jgi:glycosyltransferase involved in cell wall biosynthesis
MAEARRLLFLVNEALFFTTHWMPLANAARADGLDVHVAAPFHATYVDVIRKNGFHYHDIPLKRGGRSLIGELQLITTFVALFRRLRPDLVHHIAMKPTIWGGLASRFVGVRAAVYGITGLGYLFIGEGWRFKLQQFILLQLYRIVLRHRNCRAIFENRDDLKMFCDAGLVAAARTVLVKGCGVDLRQFAATPEPDGEVIVMFPARILRDKGAGEFVEAARLLKAAGVAARFVMVGRTDADNPTNIGEATLAEWVHQGWVEWWGFSTDMPPTLAKSHIICMPSYREGLPRGLIEAAAIGRAIVTADTPGCREIVHHEVNGLLVPVRDARATADAIKRLLDDPALRRRLASAGRAMVEAEYSVEKFTADTLAVYRAVLPSD